MVNIASLWTQYQNRTTVSAQRDITEMRRSYNKTWIVMRTLPVSIAHWLVATRLHKKGCAVTGGGAFLDDACASTKSPCALSSTTFHRVPFRMTLAPPLNHVAQCPTNISQGAFPDDACACAK
jgi:hypothetical protein